MSKINFASIAILITCVSCTSTSTEEKQVLSNNTKQSITPIVQIGSAFTQGSKGHFWSPQNATSMYPNTLSKINEIQVFLSDMKNGTDPQVLDDVNNMRSLGIDVVMTTSGLTKIGCDDAVTLRDQCNLDPTNPAFQVNGNSTCDAWENVGVGIKSAERVQSFLKDYLDQGGKFDRILIADLFKNAAVGFDSPNVCDIVPNFDVSGYGISNAVAYIQKLKSIFGEQTAIDLRFKLTAWRFTLQDGTDLGQYYSNGPAPYGNGVDLRDVVETLIGALKFEGLELDRLGPTAPYGQLKAYEIDATYGGPAYGEELQWQRLADFQKLHLQMKEKYGTQTQFKMSFNSQALNLNGLDSSSPCVDDQTDLLIEHPPAAGCDFVADQAFQMTMVEFVKEYREQMELRGLPANPDVAQITNLLKKAIAPNSPTPSKNMSEDDLFSLTNTVLKWMEAFE